MPDVTKDFPFDLDRLVKSIKRAANTGTWNGADPFPTQVANMRPVHSQGKSPYFRRCRWRLGPIGCILLFTRDIGYHTSGWWKNPDYERCYHLSLSFVDPPTGEPRPRDAVLTSLFVEALFGLDKRWLWCEPPYSPKGKQLDVWHYRLFCNDHWKPIKPRGEVYTREFTEAGWKSFSDVQAALTAEVRG